MFVTQVKNPCSLDIEHQPDVLRGCSVQSCVKVTNASGPSVPVWSTLHSFEFLVWLGKGQIRL